MASRLDSGGRLRLESRVGLLPAAPLDAGASFATLDILEALLVRNLALS